MNADRESKEVIIAVASSARCLDLLLAEHIAEYGEVLPYLYLTEVATALSRKVAEGRRDEVTTTLRVTDHFLDSGTEAQSNLIGAGFLEGFPRSGESGSEIRELVGPTSRRWLRRFRP